MGVFNNREIATSLWLIVFAVWALRNPNVRRSTGKLIRTFCHFKIIISVTLALLYVLVLIAFLHAIGLWNIGLLKDTIVWFFVGAMSMIFRFSTNDNTNEVFQKILKDSIKIVIVLEFIGNTYTFPLVVELILVPILTFIATIGAVASMNEEHAVVSKLAKAIQSVAGFLILGIAIYKAISDYQNIQSLDTFLSISLVPLLSILMFPFVYIMLVISQYEQFFLRLNFVVEKTPQLKRYARRRIIMYVGLSLKRLQYLHNNHLVDLLRVVKEQDVDQVLTQARSGIKASKQDQT